MKKFVLLTIGLILLVIHGLLWTGCTLTYFRGTTTTLSVSPSSTTTVNPHNPTDVSHDAGLVACVISNLDVSVDRDSATITWGNPTSEVYDESELYLYEISVSPDSSDDVEYTLTNCFKINRNVTSFNLTNLKPETKYMVQVISYTTSGATDFVNMEFTAGAVNTVNLQDVMSGGTPTLSSSQPARFRIAYENLYSYSSNYVDGAFLMQTGDGGQITAYDLPSGYGIDDLKWYVYWIWYDSSGQGRPDEEGDQYSDNPVIKFEESSQTFYAARQGFGFIIGYIDDYRFSNILYLDFRERIETIKLKTAPGFRSTNVLYLDETKGIHSTTLRSSYYGSNNNQLFLPALQDFGWETDNYSVISIEPKAVLSDSGKEVAAYHDCVITAKGVGKAVVTLTVNGVSVSTEFNVINIADETTDAVNTVTFDSNTLKLAVGEEFVVPYTVDPPSASSQIKLHAYTTADGTTDSDKFEIQNNTIKPLKSGTAYLKAVWNEGVSSAVTVTAVTPLQDITLNTSNVTLVPGETFSLSYKKFPKGADEFDTITYTSGNTSVATVSSSGVITAVADGTATVTVSTSSNGNDISKTVSVNVYTPPAEIPDVQSVTFSSDTLKICLNEEVPVPAYTVTPPESSSKVSLKAYTSASGTTVHKGILIRDGLIKGTISGTAYLKAIWDNGKSSAVTVSVVKPLEDLTINESYISLKPGQEFALSCTKVPSDANDYTALTFTSSNTNAATVTSSGKITAVADGKSVITIQTTSNGKTITKKVSVAVKTPPLTVSSVSFASNDDMNIKAGENVSIDYTVNPTEATSLVYLRAYTTSTGTTESDVIDIEGNSIRAIKSGTVYIRAVWDGGKSSAVKVTAVTPLDKFWLNTSNVSLNTDDNTTYSLSYTTRPAYADDYAAVTYSSSNTNVATVDSNGKITAVSSGTAKITATTTSNGRTFTGTASVSVYTPPPAIPTVSSVTFADNSAITLAPDEEIPLPAYTVSPVDAASQVTLQAFTSASGTEQSDVVEIYNNKIRALKTGKAYLRAVWDGGSSTQTIEITVAVELEDFTVNTNNVTIAPGETFRLAWTPVPSNAVMPEVQVYGVHINGKFSIDEDGLITGLGDGSAKVYLSVRINQKTITKTINVSVVTPTSVTPTVNSVVFQLSRMTLPVGRFDALPAYKVTPPESESMISFVLTTTANGTTESDVAIIRSPNKSVKGEKNLNYAQGIEGLKSGTAYLKAVWYENGVLHTSSAVKVTINVPLDTFTLNTDNVQLGVNEQYQLSYTITPSNADDYGSVTYSSSNTSVATVDNTGNITAVSSGNGTITAKTTSGKSRTVSVTVNTPVTGLTVSDDFIVLGYNKSQTVTATVSPSSAANTAVSWRSSDMTVATVDQNGKITYKGQGVACITATAAQFSQTIMVAAIDDSKNPMIPLSSMTESVTVNSKTFKTFQGGQVAVGKNDFAVKYQNKWISPFSDGIKWVINNQIVSLSNNGTATVSTSGVSFQVWIKPIIMTDGQVVFVQIIPSQETALKAGAYATLKPATKEADLVEATKNICGIQTSDIKKGGAVVNSLNFFMDCNAGDYDYITDATSLYIGDSSNLKTVVYNNTTAQTYSGATVGLTYSYTLPKRVYVRPLEDEEEGETVASYGKRQQKNWDNLKCVGMKYYNESVSIDAIIY